MGMPIKNGIPILYFSGYMDDKKNIKLTLGYDGTEYHGWQRQKNGITIQEVLEEKLKLILCEPVTIIGSGRTDAGVHALHQVCNFTTSSNIAPDALQRGLNSMLSGDISISKAEYVPAEFHSRYSVKSKIYEYRIWNKRGKDVFLRRYSWHIRETLDVDNMGQCLDLLVGSHDFSAFKSTGSENRDPVREMLRADLSRNGEGLITFVFEADGFLRHMVRNIVGTVVDAGMRKTSVNEFKEIFYSLDRTKAGVKAPPQGLFLRMVNY
jgi:tRNA pseudouridine38-40 synthase